MNNKKLFFVNIFICLLMGLFFINPTNVLALETYEAKICVDGYVYSFTTTNNNPNFGNLVGINLNDLGIASNPFVTSKRNYNRGGVNYSYVFVGTYANANNIGLTSKCYTYVDQSSTATDNNGNYSYSSSTGYKYVTKMCGSKYSTFNNDIHITDQKINSDGTTRITINIKNGSELQKNIDRLQFVVEYNGSDNKGTCTKNGNNIVCNNIKPYTPTYYNDSITNSPMYKIYFSLKNIKTSDFKENVSEDEKQKYVNSCGGNNGSIYLGYLNTTIASSDKIEVSNPSRTQTDLINLCSQVDNLSAAGSELKKAYVSECYSNKIKYSELGNLKNTIETKLKNLNRIYKKIENNDELVNYANSNELLCTDTKMGIPTESGSGSQLFESKVIYEEFDGYFGMVCIADYYVDGGIPSLVRAGMGVNYNNKVLVNKACSIIQLKKVQEKQQCHTYRSFEVRCDHDGDGVYTNADLVGGPNSNFDSCVKACDGGKYSQSCINSCYNAVYKNDRTSGNVGLSNYNFSTNYDLSKIANPYEGNFNESDAVGSVRNAGDVSNNGQYQVSMEKIGNKNPCVDVNGDGNYDSCGGPNDYRVVLKSGNDIIAETNMWALCGATCSGFVHEYKGPAGCSDDPLAEYNSEIAKAKTELNKLITLAETRTDIDDYSISITDSKTGAIYKISGTTNANKEINGPQLVITESDESSLKKYSSEFILGSRGDTVNATSATVVKTIYSVELPNAYVKIGDANVIAVENANTNRSYNYLNTYDDSGIKYYQFNEFSGFNKALFTDGNRAYYTNLDSPNYNVQINSKTEEQLENTQYYKVTTENISDIYSLVNDDKNNIQVSLTVGGSEFKTFTPTRFYCYYGVFNLIDSESCPECKGGSGSKKAGLRYYYREIKLEDVFPNGRRPRWNWSGTINNGIATGAANNSNLGYIVDPIRLTEDIEKKGETVYTLPAEVDYEWTLTPALIMTIRDYNKTKINNRKITYLDFSLTSSSRNTFSFSQKVRDWLGNIETEQITGCNNAISGKCADFSNIGG